MTSQTINNHAKAKYLEFEFTLDATRAAFDELAKLAKGLNDKGGVDRFQGWQVPTKDEVHPHTSSSCSSRLTTRFVLR